MKEGDSMYRETFPQKIKQAREKTGFTQREVAIETNISQANIAKYEKGRLEPDLEKLGILADFYQVSVDWLLGTAADNRHPEEIIPLKRR